MADEPIINTDIDDGLEPSTLAPQNVDDAQDVRSDDVLLPVAPIVAAKSKSLKFWRKTQT